MVSTISHQIVPLGNGFNILKLHIEDPSVNISISSIIEIVSFNFPISPTRVVQVLCGRGKSVYDVAGTITSYSLKGFLKWVEEPAYLDMLSLGQNDTGVGLVRSGMRGPVGISFLDDTGTTSFDNKTFSVGIRNSTYTGSGNLTLKSYEMEIVFIVDTE